MTQHEFAGRYLSGQSTRREEVRALATAAGLVIEHESGAARIWPWPEVRLALRPGANDPVRFEHGNDPVETLVVDDQAVLLSIREVAPHLGDRFRPPRDPHRKLLIAVGWSVLLVLSLVVLYTWGLPAFAAFAAARVPLEWEEALGAKVASQLAPENHLVTEPELQAAVDSLVGRLSAAAPPHRYHFRISIVREEAVNALAAPGGYVVVYTGLLRKTERAEELAGVLAHELEHVLEHDSLAGILRSSSVALLLRLFSGDAGALTNLLEMAERLGTLAYSRDEEQRADDAGFDLLLAAGIDPKGMVEFFRKLETTEEGGFSENLTYLSSHPRTADRIEKLERRAEAARNGFEPISDPAVWRALVRKACGDSLR